MVNNEKIFYLFPLILLLIGINSFMYIFTKLIIVFLLFSILLLLIYSFMIIYTIKYRFKKNMINGVLLIFAILFSFISMFALLL